MFKPRVILQAAGWLSFFLLLALVCASSSFASYFQPIMAQEPPNDVERYELMAGSVEIEELRTLNSLTFQRPDGKRTVVVGGDVDVFEDAQGRMRRATPTFNMDNVAATNATLTGNNLTVRTRTLPGIQWGLPDVTKVRNGAKITYTDDGVVWEYTKGNHGVKHEGLVPGHKGEQTYTFPYTATGGLDLNDDGSLSGDGFVIPLASVTDGTHTEFYEWTLTPTSISITFDDAGFNLPYTIDPTTNFPIGVGGDDGAIVSVNAAYPPACSSASSTDTTILTFKDGLSSGITRVRNGMMRWDTSSLPDTATINSATITAVITTTLDESARNFNAEYGTFTWPLTCADYSASVGTTAFSIDITGISSPFTLGTLTSINKTGYTEIRTGISGGAPGDGNDNWVQLRSFEGGGGPQLNVTFTEMVVTSISPDEAAANGSKSFTVTGDELTGVTAIALTKTAQSNINCSSVVVVNDTTVTANCNLTGAVDGLWNVMATKSSGSVTGNNLLDIHHLAIDTVTPNTASAPLGSEGLTIDGDGFDTGIQVTMTRSGQSTIVCTAETITITFTRLTTTCDFTGRQSGTWNVVVTNTDSDTATLTNGFTVPPITVTAVDNTPVAANGSKNFEITGTLFTGVVAVRLEKAGESNINCSSVVVVNDTEVTFTCNLTGAVDGLWSIVASTANSSGTGVNLLDIQAISISTSVPTSTFPTAPIGLTIEGEGFDTGIQVTLLKSGESTVSCTAETITITLVEVTTTCDVTGIAEGFWDVRATNTDAAFATLVNGLFISDVITLQALNIEDGEHRITIQFDADDVFLFVDDELVDQFNKGSAIDYIDNSNDWEILTNNSIPAMEYMQILDNDVPMLWYQIMALPNLFLTDVSGEGNTVIARYPDTPAGFTTQIQPLEATGVVVDPAGGGSETIGAIGPLSNATPTEFSNVPVFNGFFDIPKVLLFHLATVSDVPYNVVLILAGFMITAAFGLAAAVFRQSFMIYIAMIMGSTFSIFYGDGVWGWIVPITFAAICSPILVKYLRA